MPAATGDGERQIERYFFNYQRRACEIFIFKGEGGNANSFETKNRCEQVCHPGENIFLFISFSFLIIYRL